MLQHVTNVLIGKKATTATAADDTMAVGDVAVFDQDGKIVSDASTASAIRIGVCKGHANYTDTKGVAKKVAIVDYTSEIQKGSHPSMVTGEYTAPVEESAVIDLTNAEIVIGHRYVIRIVYKDFEVANFQFTHTYEVYAESEAAADLAAAFQKKINAHPNRRISVALEGAKLTLTAMVKDDNEGVNSLNTYSRVDMEVSLYKTIPGALLSNQPESVTGATVTLNAGNPGRGYWKQVRDAEVKNMGYKGQVFTGAYPSVEQKRMVTEDAEYDWITIEHDNVYLSDDNQYLKTTPITAEIYMEGGASTISDIVKGFIEA